MNVPENNVKDDKSEAKVQNDVLGETRCTNEMAWKPLETRPHRREWPAGSRRQCLAQDSAGTSGLRRQKSQGWDPRTQERKERTHSGWKRATSAGKSGPTAGLKSTGMIPRTQGTQQDRGDARCHGTRAQAPTVQKALKAWKLSEDIEIPVSTQRQPGFLSCSALTRRSISLLRTQKTP